MTFNKVPLRTSFGNNRYGWSENDFVCTSANGDARPKPALVVCHPHGATALSMFSDPGYVRLYQGLAERFVVSVADVGGGGPTVPQTTWGNGYTQGAINNIVSMLQNTYGAAPGKFGLIGMSMGGGVCLNYIHANPSRAAFFAGIVPMNNLNDLRFYRSSIDGNDGVTLGDYAGEIDTAYNGAYSDASYGADYNPYLFRDTYPDDTVRTGFWHTPADTVVREVYTNAFLAANPRIDNFSIVNSSGVGASHPNAVVPAVDGLAVGSPYDFMGVTDWCLQQAVDTAF